MTCVSRMACLLVLPAVLQGAAVLPEELAARDDWVSARLEGRRPDVQSEPALVVFANHGPVLVSARAGKPLRIAGRDFAHGMCCHAPSRILVVLPGRGRAFTASVGIDSNEMTSGGRGSVVFSVLAGGAERFRSGVLREGMPAVLVDADLAGATEFVIQADETPDGIGHDHADWLDAKVALEDGRETRLADLPVREARRLDLCSAEPPFSFVYGGAPSPEFLPKWKIERSSRALDPHRTERTLTWTDAGTGLQVRCTAVLYARFPTVEWTLHFKNTSAADTPILSDIQAVDLAWERPFEGEFVLHHHTGDNCTADSYQPHALPLPPGADARFAPAGGRPTTDAFPYFNIEWQGGGLIAVIGWPGQWAARFTRDADRGLRVRGGQELTRFTLRPGEEVRSPLVALQFWKSGDWIRAQNIWRRWLVEHNLPRPGGTLVPTHYASCFGNERPLAAEEIEQVEGWFDAGIKLDYWFIDTGWFVHPDGWWNTGTWDIDRERFPKGLREVADRVHARGAKFIVWFEPERLVDGSWLERNHPEWILRDGGARLLDLGNQEAWKWVLEHFDALITAEGIDVYRQDFNMSPLGCWRAADAPDRQGIAEIRHVEGYLAYWDELLRRHPDLLIDSCASGGRRNDIETLRRSVPLLRSDYPLGGAHPSIADGQQCHTMGLSLWIPHHGTGLGIADAYAMRSAFAPAFRIGWDVRNRSIDLPLLRKTVEDFRRTEEFWLGDFYPLTRWSLAGDVWLAWQFDRPEAGKGFVQAFRRADSPYETARFRLRGLDPAARYAVADLDAPGQARELSGRELTELGLPVTLPAQRSSAILIYARTGGAH